MPLGTLVIVVFCYIHYDNTLQFRKDSPVLRVSTIHTPTNMLRCSCSNNIHEDCHQMETFPALLALCAENSLVNREFPTQSQWRIAFMFSLICAWINGLNKQSWRWWFETPSLSLWRHCNVLALSAPYILLQLTQIYTERMITSSVAIMRCG